MKGEEWTNKLKKPLNKINKKIRVPAQDVYISLPRINNSFPQLIRQHVLLICSLILEVNAMLDIIRSLDLLNHGHS